MSKYPLRRLSPIYALPIIHPSYSSQPHYYSFSEYLWAPRDRYSSSNYYDNQESPFVEYHHCSHDQFQRPNHRQYFDYRNENRARSTSSQVQQTTAFGQTNSRRLSSNTDHSNGEYETRNSMSENDNREHGVLKRDIKRSTHNAYKSLNASEFLARTPAEIKQEFRKMPNPPAKDPFAAKEEKNLDKSRYRDVIPGEATRVKLQPDSEDKHDFINANYVSGYDNQEHAYIFTQGPLQSTVKDFWRMVWQENIAIVVMTTNIRESGTIKCFQYWPAESKGTLNAGLYQIHNEKSEKYSSFVITTLILRNKTQPDDIRTIYHAHYLKWPDHGVPTGTKDALLFLEKVEYYRQLSTMTKSPVLLHCSAGIGRTGTFCAVDIGIRRYLETNMIDIPSVVVKMRTERAGSVQTEDQYLFAHLALMDYIKQHQIIQQRTHESAPLSEKDSSNTSDGTQVKDNKDFSEFDDHLCKSSRMKIHGKKSHEFGQTHTLPAMHEGKTSHLTEPGTSYRGKTLSDSSTTAVHYLTPVMCTSQAEPSRQRASTDQISSISTPTGSAHHKKARK